MVVFQFFSDLKDQVGPRTRISSLLPLQFLLFAPSSLKQHFRFFPFLRRATVNRVSSFQECKIIVLKIERTGNQRPHCDHCSLPPAFQCPGQVKKSCIFSKDSHDIFLEDCSQCEHLPKNSIQAHSSHVWGHVMHQNIVKPLTKLPTKTKNHCNQMKTAN